MTVPVWRGLFGLLNPKIKGVSASVLRRTYPALGRYPSGRPWVKDRLLYRLNLLAADLMPVDHRRESLRPDVVGLTGRPWLPTTLSVNLARIGADVWIEIEIA